jgi:hypothetical protein
MLNQHSWAILPPPHAGHTVLNASLRPLLPPPTQCIPREPPTPAYLFHVLIRSHSRASANSFSPPQSNVALSFKLWRVPPRWWR